MDKVIYEPIGIVHTPYKDRDSVPVKPLLERDTEGVIEIFPQYQEGLTDLEGFSHIILLCHFHQSKEFSLMVNPPWDDKPHGLFSTRSPNRPNSIGLSTVQLKSITDNKLTVIGVDMIDGTPLLDIKPYVTKVDWKEKPTIGWLENASKKDQE